MGWGWPVLLLAYAALVLAFVGTNPPGEASDEPAHFYKAAALAHGRVRGEPVAITGYPGWTPSMLAWVSQTTRELAVPEHLTGCDAFRLSAATCDGRITTSRPVADGHQLSYVGTYPPAAYGPAAAGILIAEAVDASPATTVRAARASGALVDLALLAVAGALASRGRRAPVMIFGLAVTVTPIVLFTMSQVSNSGREITAALCFASALLRLTAETSPPEQRAVWLAAGVSGLLFTTSRSTSPAWCAFVLAIVVLARPRQAWSAARHHRRAALAAASAVTAGALSTVAWEVVVEPSPPRVSAGQILNNLPFALGRLDEVADQVVGRLGWISILLERQTVYLWWMLLLAILVVALVVGTWWERVVLTVGLVGIVALTLLVDAGIQQPSSRDFQMQARYVYAAGLVLPLLAADIIRRRPSGTQRPGLEPVLCAAGMVLLLQLAAQAVVLNGRVRYHDPLATPPLGWSTLELLAALVVAVGGMGAALLARGRPAEVEGPSATT